MAVWNVIGHTELGASATSVSFTSISASYDHLVLLSSARSDDAGVYDFMNFQVNGDTGTNYTRTALNTNSGTPNSVAGTGGSYWTYNYIPAAGALADTFGTCETWFIDYSNTSNYTQIMTRSGMSNNSTTDSQWGIRFEGGLWLNTAAINRVDALQESGDDFVQYSTFTLYGINGAG